MASIVQMLTGKVMENFVSAIEAYHDNKVGYGWDLFWDYRSSLESLAKSPLDDDCLLDTAVQLSAYLASFGMYRNSRLSSLSAYEFKEIIESSRKAFESVADIRFESLAEADRARVVGLFNAIGGELQKFGVSSTATMVTKMSMALWGQVPAFDSFARQSMYRLGLSGKSRQFPNKYQEVFEAMLILKHYYTDLWAEGISRLSKEKTMTRPNGFSQIPIARLIDMGLWWLGSSRAER